MISAGRRSSIASQAAVPLITAVREAFWIKKILLSLGETICTKGIFWIRS